MRRMGGEPSATPLVRQKPGGGRAHRSGRNPVAAGPAGALTWAYEPGTGRAIAIERLDGSEGTIADWVALQLAVRVVDAPNSALLAAARVRGDLSIPGRARVSTSGSPASTDPDPGHHDRPPPGYRRPRTRPAAPPASLGRGRLPDLLARADGAAGRP
jgi:hypothetical protein